MYEYEEECLKVFLEQQAQLLGKQVINTMEEADEFLTQGLAEVCENVGEVKEYMDEMGMDISGMSEEELLSQSEIFPLSEGRYLVIGG
ncbi:MAG: glyoxalase [Lachnospiraceae bacterium]